MIFGMILSQLLLIIYAISIQPLKSYSKNNQKPYCSCRQESSNLILIGIKQKMQYLQKKSNQQQIQTMQQQPNNMQTFLDKYVNELTKDVKNTSTNQIKAKILREDQYQFAAKMIAQGQLVAFPTQTVYGLGANAFNPDALQKIYTTKRRPLTDPIIVHVLNAEQGEKLVLMSQKQRQLFQLLTKQFWPGPLTIILKANLELLPLIVTAQTGFVGIRAPQHPFARKLIQVSKLPIGAPSANLFSHVSPTEPVHVFNDFYDREIFIVDGQRCKYGIQSTVVKVVDNEIHVFREGSLSVKKLQDFLKSSCSEKELPSIIVHKKTQSKHKNMQSPGQLLKHYAPYLPCYYYTKKEVENPRFQINAGNQKQTIDLSDVAFISFNKQHFNHYLTKAKYYFQIGQNMSSESSPLEQDIFCTKQQKERMRQIYYLLRKCENLDVKLILVGWSGLQQGTIWDKIYRSTQGVQMNGE